ncbi:MAG TPA: endonuclease/exonuclease/phosphatase family protein [Jiangellaceae bacterium]
MVTVATWNVENLFLPGTPDGPSNPDVYARKLAYLTSVIVAAGSDVVCLQEVGGEQPLADLQSALGGVLPYSAIGQPDDRGIRVAVLSRFPITEGYDWVDFPAGGLPAVPDADGNVITAMGRGALETVLTLADGRKLRVVTTHLKSKILSFPGDRRYPLDEDERARGAGYALVRRAAEAVAVRVELNTWMPREPDVPVVLAGDLNDEPHAVTTTLLAGPADADPNQPDRFDPYRLYNLADRLPPARAFSRIYRQRRELIDHVLISRKLLLAGVTADAFVDDIVGIDEDIDSRRDAVVPDHAMVFARISWP